MQEGSDRVEHLNVFNQMVADLARREVTVDDEDKAMPYSLELISHGTVFLSQQIGEQYFSPGFSAKRTGPIIFFVLFITIL